MKSSLGSPLDPLRVRCLELCQAIEARAQTLRDYATTPGNAWLAKGELQAISQLVSDLETILEQIKQADEASA
jgi:hypothetical protein